MAGNRYEDVVRFAGFDLQMAGRHHSRALFNWEQRHLLDRRDAADIDEHCSNSGSRVRATGCSRLSTMKHTLYKHLS